jgi:hypothetical protein
VVRDFAAAFVDISRPGASRRFLFGSARIHLEPAAGAARLISAASADIDAVAEGVAVPDLLSPNRRRYTFASFGRRWTWGDGKTKKGLDSACRRENPAP